MTTIAEIERTLPWGLHDAYLERVEVDWVVLRAVLELRLMVGKHQETDRRARVVVDGLVFLSIDPPLIDPPSYEAATEHGLRLDSGEGASPYAKDLPAVPKGCFLHHLLVANWNYRALHVCGRTTRFEWIESKPIASSASTRALFPGEEIPDPE